MKTLKIFATFAVLVLGIQFAQAQQQLTDAEKKLMELRARRAVAKEMTEGGNLLTLEADANTYEVPCTIYDDAQWYTAFNQKEGRPGDPQLANSLLRSCQQQLKDKLAGRVQQITNTYFDQLDINGKSSEAEHIEGASRMAVDQFVNETQEYCRRQSIPDERTGNVVVYMSIRVSKKEVLQAMENGIQKDAEAKVRFNEQQFREAAFKVFDEK